MKHIKILNGKYQVAFPMKKVSHGASRNTSVGVYDSIMEAINIRDYVSSLRSKQRSLIRKDILKLVNKKRKEMGLYPIRNSQSS